MPSLLFIVKVGKANGLNLTQGLAHRYVHIVDMQSRDQGGESRVPPLHPLRQQLMPKASNLHREK